MPSTTLSRMPRSPRSRPRVFICGPVNGEVCAVSVMSPLSARSAAASRRVAWASARGEYERACATSLSTTNGRTPMRLAHSLRRVGEREDRAFAGIGDQLVVVVGGDRLARRVEAELLDREREPRQIGTDRIDQALHRAGVQLATLRLRLVAHPAGELARRFEHVQEALLRLLREQ